MPSGPDKFDYIETKHNHAVCQKCGKVFDFVYDIPKNKMQKQIKNQTSIETELDTITVFGICEKCKSK